MSISAQKDADPTDPSAAAARLLAITARDTDQWRAEARSEADAVVAAARAEAAEIVRAAREEAERLANDARVETYREREKAERLQRLAAEHREQLRSHLTEMLQQVEATPDGSRAG
jgi:cell division septum initiation protein DivIVA